MAPLKRRTKADVARDWDRPPQRFLHGTTSALMDSIRRGGLREPCLASSWALAEYYAGTAVDEHGGRPVVLECLDIDESLLRLDRAAMDEPVGCDDGCVEKALRLAGRDHPELRGDVPIPPGMWQASWAGVGSARYAGTVRRFAESEVG
jgi:hypothetical protein